jgi:signal transduction histidine kinase
VFIAAVRRLPRAVVGYLIALATLGIASGITEVVLHTTGSRPIISVVFLLAILVVAWWGGYGPGIFATLLTVFIVPSMFAHRWILSTVNFTQMVLVLLISILVSSVAAARYKVEAALRDANERLDERVRERTAELQRANQTLEEHKADLLRQSDELARSNADLQQFAYVASHDLQEPLRLIALYTELLGTKYQGQLDSEAEKYIGVITQGVGRMEALIRDLLIYSRTIHSDLALVEPIDPADAIRAARFNLEAVIEQSDATIVSGSLPVVVINRVQLIQVFQNLFSNAMKYKGAAAPVINVTANQEQDIWVFSVQDNGMGIHRDYHETIFNPFKRLHGPEFAGTGVGLAICRRIVERNRGRIWVESAPGSGSTFFFTVPIA